MDYSTDSEITAIVARVMRQANTASVPATAPEKVTEAVQPAAASTAQLVAIGSDHGGFELKAMLIEHIQSLGYQPVDCGTHSKESVDYPDFAQAVAEKVASGSAWRGIVIDAAGIGSCMAANKVPGVRAAMCYDYASASNSREHNDANVLSLGAGLIGANQAKLIVKTWLATAFGGERHQRRIDKITAIEQRYSVRR